MFLFWLVVSTIVTGLALLISFLLGCQSWEHRRYARRRLATPRTETDQRRVALFAPCKGVDLGFKDNLRPLFQQDHDNYEIVFIVESDDDPACPVIRSLMTEYEDVPSSLVVAGRATHCCQKVHNLRAATRCVGADVEIFAFVDSDARPQPGWLGQLVDRLDREKIGITTGYRWFVPERPTLANHLLYSINATSASLYTPKRLQPVWGGSWAMRREVFERTKLDHAWHSALTDDLVASNVMKQARLRVVFEPGCVIASPLDVSFGQMFDFLRRQYLIGRHYLPNWWALTLLASTITVLGFWGSLAMLAVGVVSQSDWTWAPALTCAGLYILGMVRALIRRDLAHMYVPRLKRELAPAIASDMWTTPLATLVNWAALLSTVGARRLVWRGITYQLLPGGMTRVVSRQDEPVPAGARWSATTAVVRAAAGGQANEIVDPDKPHSRAA